MRNEALKAPETLLGRTVAEVLEALDLDLAPASRLTEPPGKLKALSFSLEGEGVGAVRAIGLYLKYESRLFSEYMDWADSAILQTEVIGIRIKWEDRAEDFGEANHRFYH